MGNIKLHTSAKLFLRALALHRAGNLNDAETLYHTLLASNPKHGEALSLLGTIYAQRGNYEEGIRLMGEAISVKPNHAEAYFNRALSKQMLSRYEDALADYEKATVLDPTCAKAFWHKSLNHLTLGQYEKGWKLYEWRWKTRSPEEVRAFRQRLWLGNEALENKTILIHAEQGFGDTIQFCRYVPKVEALGAKVVFEVPAPLAGLMSTLKGSFRLVERGNPLPEFDLHCPLLSLPLAFKTLVNTIPADVPYLFAAPLKRKIWQDRLGEKSKPRIGLTWSGGKSRKLYDNRSIPLHLLAPLGHFNYEYHCLQKEFKNEDIAVLKQLGHITSHADSLNDFSDTAALMSEMDLIISIDTSVAHLAGALGKPLWVLLHYASDWRWMLARKDSPWYPSARLFRQSFRNDWAGVIAEVNTELQVSDL
jgi:tetratricopeptide (TPR) repeat protein